MTPEEIIDVRVANALKGTWGCWMEYELDGEFVREEFTGNDGLGHVHPRARHIYIGWLDETERYGPYRAHIHLCAENPDDSNNPLPEVACRK